MKNLERKTLSKKFQLMPNLFSETLKVDCQYMFIGFDLRCEVFDHELTT